MKYLRTDEQSDTLQPEVQTMGRDALARVGDLFVFGGLLFVLGVLWLVSLAIPPVGRKIEAYFQDE